jgi:hypothetical protein
MIGTAEDHHSNPMKIALGKFKRAGGRFISINPVRTGLFGHRGRVDPDQARAPTAPCSWRCCTNCSTRT